MSSVPPRTETRRSPCASVRQPDAMTLDLAMPGLGGIDVLKALRQRGGPAIPVVVVSAFSPAHGAYAVDALAEGAFELVPKPTGQAERQRVRAEPAHQDPRRHQDAPPRRPPALSARVPQRQRRRRWRARRRRPPPTATLRARRGRRVRIRSGLSRALLIATSTGGPRALAEVVPGLPVSAGPGHDDRAAHARRLHRLAGRPPGSLEPAQRPRSPGRRVAGAGRGADRPGRPPPAAGHRPAR